MKILFQNFNSQNMIFLRKPLFIALLGGLFNPLFAQNAPENDADALFIRQIYDKALTESQAYNWLRHLCTQIGGRLSGSTQAERAVEYTRKMLDTLHADSVWLQPCMVPHWERGQKPVVSMKRAKSMSFLNTVALGGSVGTNDKTLKGNIIEVKTLDEVDQLGEKAKGKIIFFNRPMDPKQINTFSAYGGANDQRVFGASRAAKQGAIAVLVRSLTTRIDDFPHTGTMIYTDSIPKIPALSISTRDAEKLSKALKEEANLEISVRSGGKMLPEVPSNNVIAEWKGSEFPNEIILIGGHLDSWDLAQGAHDDGAGCVQAMDVLNLMKRLNYRPKRTIRCVLFMNEENGTAGGRKYAEIALQNEQNKGEKHILAIESDAGGFTPRGFSFDGDNEIFAEKFKKLTSLVAPLLEPYDLSFKKGGSGSDISPMKKHKVFLAGFRPDSQRYFDLHHTAEDTFDKINQRELELGAAAITSLIYIIDKYGLN
jgi:carboxypeptidase Q